jgi:hypothetical protein
MSAINQNDTWKNNSSGKLPYADEETIRLITTRNEFDILEWRKQRVLLRLQELNYEIPTDVVDQLVVNPEFEKVLTDLANQNVLLETFSSEKIRQDTVVSKQQTEIQRFWESLVTRATSPSSETILDFEDDSIWSFEDLSVPDEDDMRFDIENSITQDNLTLQEQRESENKRI